MTGPSRDDLNCWNQWIHSARVMCILLQLINLVLYLCDIRNVVSCHKVSEIKNGNHHGKVSDGLLFYILYFYILVVQTFRLEPVMPRLKSIYSHSPHAPLLRKTFHIDIFLFYFITATRWNRVTREWIRYPHNLHVFTLHSRYKNHIQ